MRKILPLALAVAIVAVAAVAILTSSEVLSFSMSEDRNDAPAHRYNDEVQTDYHFAPDFMCMLDDYGAIECLGSNAHGVISKAPAMSGFTEIDGGDTYACAYHARSDFDYCWGAIDRAPSSAPPPTPTEEPAPTVEPTEEPVATEVPMPTPTEAPEADPCRIDLPDFFLLPLTQTGSWIEECVYPSELDNVAEGDRYYRWVGFVPGDAPTAAPTNWIATLESDMDTVMVLFEWNAEEERWDFVEMNDDDPEGGTTNSRIEWTPVVGQEYALVLTTYTANTLGDFTLTITVDIPARRNSSTEQRMMPSGLSGAMPLERRQ